MRLRAPKALHSLQMAFANTVKHAISHMSRKANRPIPPIPKFLVKKMRIRSQIPTLPRIINAAAVERGGRQRSASPFAGPAGVCVRLDLCAVAKANYDARLPKKVRFGQSEVLKITVNTEMVQHIAKPRRHGPARRPSRQKYDSPKEGLEEEPKFYQENLVGWNRGRFLTPSGDGQPSRGKRWWRPTLPPSGEG